jgi:hypothetical protein
MPPPLPPLLNVAGLACAGAIQEPEEEEQEEDEGEYEEVLVLNDEWKERLQKTVQRLKQKHKRRS